MGKFTVSCLSVQWSWTSSHPFSRAPSLRTSFCPHRLFLNTPTNDMFVSLSGWSEIGRTQVKQAGKFYSGIRNHNSCSVDSSTPPNTHQACRYVLTRTLCVWQFNATSCLIPADIHAHMHRTWLKYVNLSFCSIPTSPAWLCIGAMHNIKI